MKFVYGIASCSQCNKWNGAVVEEPEGAPPRIGGLQCASCNALDACSFARLGHRPTDVEAMDALDAWLADQGLETPLRRTKGVAE